MTLSIDDARDAWHAVANARVATIDMIERATTAMELVPTRYLDEQGPIARRLVTLATEMGRPDLMLRARLIGASIEMRDGAPLDASARLDEIRPLAEELGDKYVLARMHYLRAWVAYFIGDEPSCQISATTGVTLLPESAPAGVRIDHLAVMGVAFGDNPEYYEEALRLAVESADSARVITLHNNIAFSALLRGDAAVALPHVEEMLAESRRSGTSLGAVHLETIARTRISAGDPAGAVAMLSPVWEVVSRSPLGASEMEVDDSNPLNSSVFAAPHSVPASLLTLAEAHRKLGELGLAQEILNRADELITERRLRLVRPDALREQALIYETTGDFEQAYRYYVLFHEAAMAQQSEEQRARARIVQASYQIDRTRKDAEHYRDLAMRDPLTGLYNRRYLTELLGHEIPRAQQEGRALSLAIIDADFFKRINDELSHDIGDKVLQEIARIMVDIKPEGATVCRLGGEEFVIAMPGADADNALAACEEVRRTVAGHDWAPLTGVVPVAVSVGVTTALGGHTSMAALLADADRNLYAAKRSGRNRVMGDAR